MLFILPDPDSPKYLHKIYVKEKYRGNGIGKQILTSFLESEKKIKICLLCSKDNVPFYEISGFHVIKSLDASKSGNFLLSNDLYLGLYLMSNYDEVSDAPIFLLNDTDIRKIVGI